MKMRYLLTPSAGAGCGVQLKQEQHQDPQEAGGAQRLHQLAQQGQPTVVGHVGQRVSEHVNNPCHNGVHVSRGILRETAGLETQVICLTTVFECKLPFVNLQLIFRV